MKKIIILLNCLILTGVMSGCGINDYIEKETDSTVYNQNVEYSNSMETKSPIPGTSDNTENTIVTKSTSQDGQYEVTSEVNQAQGIYKVVLSSCDGNKILNSFNIVGKNHSYLWSPDNKKVCVSYQGRIWGNFSIIDTSIQTLIEHPSIIDIMDSLKAKDYKFDYELNENRPDAYFTPIEWSPDSKKILIFYQWHDTNYATQNGVFIYDLEKNDVYNLIQNKPYEEGGFVEAKKPEEFMW